MSLLAEQLQTLRGEQRLQQIGPNLPQPSILFDPVTARSTSLDVIYTMAVLGYSKLLSCDPSLRRIGDLLFNDAHKHLNRNQLTRQQNSEWSQQLMRFMVQLSPYLLNPDCQKILQYLLRNYKVHIFQTQSLVIIFLQYWNYEIYAKLVANIPKSNLRRVAFLGQLLNCKVPINLAFIVKSLAYSHHLLDMLVMYVYEFTKLRPANLHSMETEIKLGEGLEEDIEQVLIRNDPKRFLLQIFMTFISQRSTAHYKYIVDFCLKVASLTKADKQVLALVMLLAARLINQKAISNVCLQKLLCKLLRGKSSNNSSNLFDFVLIVWQRRRECISLDTISQLEHSPTFHEYLGRSNHSLHMVLLHLVMMHQKGAHCINLLNLINIRVKAEEFYRNYSPLFLQTLFAVYFDLIHHETSTRITEIDLWIGENYLRELATFLQGKNVEPLIGEHLIQAFPGKVTLQKGCMSFNIAGIATKLPKAKAQKTINKQKQMVSQSPNQQSQDEQVNLPKRRTLCEIIGVQGVSLDSIDFDREEICTMLQTLLDSYYSKDSRISRQQKQYIFQRKLSLYTLDRMRADLARREFNTPIKYLTVKDNLQFALLGIMYTAQDLHIVDDLLFRELFRLCLQRIVDQAANNYKPTINFVNSFFKKMSQKYLGADKRHGQTDIGYLNDILLKVSQSLFGRVGIERGKYHRLIHNHCRVLSEFIFAFLGKTKGVLVQEKTISATYLQILRVFGTANLYLINIGLVEQLSRVQLNLQPLKYFSTSVLLPCLANGHITFAQHAASLGKTLYFSSQLTDSIRIKSYVELDASLTSGIARNVITEFYGLIKDRFRRVLVRKLFIFLQLTFAEPRFASDFNTCLQTLPKEQMHRLLHIYSEIFKLLINFQTDIESISSVVTTVLDKLTDMFPLELRLILFEPLLPNEILYLYMAEKLEAHTVNKTQFPRLTVLANIPPESISQSWLRFLKQCLKRGCALSEATIANFFNISAQEVPKDLLGNYSQLICELSEQYKEKLYPHLEQCMSLIELQCHSADEYALAVVYRLIQNCGEMIDPYLQSFLVVTCDIDSRHCHKFLEDVAGFLQPSTLIRLVKLTFMRVTNLFNFTVFMQHVANRGVGDSLIKTLQLFCSRVMQEYLQNESDCETIVDRLAEVFLAMAIKFNENQLRKVVIDYAKWAESKNDVDQDLPFNHRKIVLHSIFCCLAQKLGQLFTPFFGYTFEGILKDFINIIEHLRGKTKDTKVVKRDRPQSHYSLELIGIHLKKCLHSLQLLFEKDLSHDFLDVGKFDTLSGPLSDLFLVDIPLQLYQKVVDQCLIPCFLALCSHTPDDYQLKSLNYKILLLLKHKSSQVQASILGFLEQLIDHINDRYLLFVNDLVPFLVELAHSRTQQVKRLVNSIIYKVEQLSGDKIQNYLK